MKKQRDESEISAIRERILSSALSIFETEGFSQLTMRALAKKMDMTAPNLYNYFSGKDEIYLYLVIQGFTLLRDRFSEAEKAHPDPAERGRALMAAYLAFGRENPAHYGLMFTHQTPKYNDYVGTRLEKLSLQELTLSLEVAAIADRAFQDLARTTVGLSDLDARAGVIGVWGLLHGLVSLLHSGVVQYVAPDTDAVYQKVMDSCFSLLSLAGKNIP
ncbi:MAG: TetR/AcrR family transcriptional regulator [Thermodesulfobacteriota bacterium]